MEIVRGDGGLSSCLALPSSLVWSLASLRCEGELLALCLALLSSLSLFSLLSWALRLCDINSIPPFEISLTHPSCQGRESLSDLTYFPFSTFILYGSLWAKFLRQALVIVTFLVNLSSQSRSHFSNEPVEFNLG